MLEPNKNLASIFERAIKLAIKNKHEYVTLEHFLFSIISDKDFEKVLTDFGADVTDLKNNLDNFIKTRLKDIEVEELTEKPRKTNSIERMLNRAFTQVLFSGRTIIEPTDCFIALFSEKKSHALHFMQLAGIDKDKFIDFINNETEQPSEAVDEVSNAQLEEDRSSYRSRTGN